MPQCFHLTLLVEHDLRAQIPGQPISVTQISGFVQASTSPPREGSPHWNAGLLYLMDVPWSWIPSFPFMISISSLKTQVHTWRMEDRGKGVSGNDHSSASPGWRLLQWLTRKGSYWGALNAAASTPYRTRHLVRIHICRQNPTGLWSFPRSHKWFFTACIKCEFLAFPSNTVVLEFLNINEVWFLSVILSNEAQNNTSQISVTGKIFVV